MKQKKIHKILNWIKDAWLKAIVVFLIVAGGFYAYATITWPGDEPNATTGVVGMFVGESTETFGQTPATTGYDKVSGLCASVTGPDTKIVTGGHVCTPDEMVNSYNHGTVGISAIFTYNTSTTLWINSGPPGFLVNANDCVGWTTTASGTSDNPNMGAIWNFVSDKGNLLKCQTGKKFACCK